MEGDELKSLKAHIKRELRKGYSPDLIKHSLIDAGFSSSDVNNTLSKLKAEKVIKEPQKKPLFSGLFRGPAKKPPRKELKIKPAKPVVIPKLQETETTEIPEIPKPYREEVKPLRTELIREPRKTRLWVFGFLAVLLIVFVVFGLAYVAPTRCKTEDCFISKANNCFAATYTNQIEGTTFYYETNKCILTKTVNAMDPSEPQAIVDAFLGKSMRCKFNKNDFGLLYLNSITGYLEACEGPLKDKILEMART